MLEQPLGSDTIQLGTKPARIAFLAIFGAILVAAPLAALLLLPADRLDVAAPALGTFGTMFLIEGVVFAVLAALSLLHRRDYLVIDDTGVTAYRLGRPTQLAWADVLEVDTYGWLVTLKGQGTRLRIPLHMFGDDQPALDRLRLRLEPFWQARLRRLETEWIRLTPRWLVLIPILMAVAMLSPLIMFGVMLCSGPMMSRGLGQIALPMALPVVVLVALSCRSSMWGMFRRAAGPGAVLIGLRRVALERVHTVHVVRARGSEIWYLRGPRLPARIENGFGFPLLCEHIIRHCHHATFTYDVRAPRSPIEAAFLPLPPGATKELLVAPDTKTAMRAMTRSFGPTMLGALAFPVLMLSMAEWQSYSWRHERHVEYQQQMADARATTATLVERENCWHGEFEVGGQTYETHIYAKDRTPPGVAAGQTVPIHYRAPDPEDAWFGEAYRPPFDDATPTSSLALLSLGLLMGLSSAILTWRQRRNRPQQPTAVGF